MKSNAPRLYGLYEAMLIALLAWGPYLVRNFAHSVFAAITYNFGPVTACFPHVDEANLAFGWCAVTALGSFDHTRGGHLVLWNLGIIIPFPPGSTILLPSALLVHSNIPIRDGETRYSVTSYSPGGLFRWWSNGCKSDRFYNENKDPAVKAEWLRQRVYRWKRGVNLLEVLE